MGCMEEAVPLESWLSNIGVAFPKKMKPLTLFLLIKAQRKFALFLKKKKKKRMKRDNFILLHKVYNWSNQYKVDETPPSETNNRDSNRRASAISKSAIISI